MNEKDQFTVSSGNIFADLGDPAPQESLLKAQFAHRIGVAIRERQLTQSQAAQILGIDQPKVSALLRGRLANFSVDRLIKYVTALGNDVDIVVHPKAAAQEERGTVQIHDNVAALAALERAGPQLGSLRANALIEARAEEAERRRRRQRTSVDRSLPTPDSHPHKH